MTTMADHLTWCDVRNGYGACTCGLAAAGVPIEKSTSTSATVQTLADVAPERVAWLWQGRLPLGKLVVIDGDPSTGKSTLTLDLAARVSTGSTWPDGAAGRGPAGVLLLSAEDGLADTIAPRLIAAGANLARVHALTEVPAVNDDGEVRQVPPSLPRDIPIIEKTVAQHRVRLVVVDVLMAYLNGKVDSHRDQDVRGVLHQLAAMAERTGCTVVLIRHLNKAGGSNALYRGGGSIGIVGAARAAYLVARDPEDEARRIFAVTKCNLALEPPSLAYRLVSDDANGCARVEWEDAPVEHTATSLLRAPVDEDEHSERDEAANWLTTYLMEQGGEATAGEVLKAGRGAGFATHVLQRARKRAGVASRKAGFGSGWVWALSPEGDTKTTKNTGHRVLSSSSSSPSSSADAPPAAVRQLHLAPVPDGDCGHPASHRTTTGKCGSCIAERQNRLAHGEDAS